MADDREGITDWDDDENGVNQSESDSDSSDLRNGLSGSEEGSESGSEGNDAGDGGDAIGEDDVDPVRGLANLEWSAVVDTLEPLLAHPRTSQQKIWTNLETKIRRQGIPETVFPQLLALAVTRVQLCVSQDVRYLCGRVVGAALSVLATNPDSVDVKRVVASIDKAGKSSPTPERLLELVLASLHHILRTASKASSEASAQGTISAPATLAPTLTVILRLLRNVTSSVGVKTVSKYIPTTLPAVTMYHKAAATVLAKETDASGLAVLVGAGWFSTRRLRDPARKTLAAEAKPAVLTWFNSAIVSPIRLPNPGTVDALASFIGFLDAKDIEQITSVAEKAVPRTPEVACTVLGELALHLNTEPTPLLLRVTSPLIDLLKSPSTTPLSRTQAFTALRSLISLAHRFSPSTYLDQPINLILNILTTARPPSAEARAALYSTLGACAPPQMSAGSMSAKVLDVVLAAAGKETSDICLSSLIEALGAHVVFAGDNAISSIAAFLSGSVISGKVPTSTRRGWTTKLAEVAPPSVIASGALASSDAIKGLVERISSFVLRTAVAMGGELGPLPGFATVALPATGKAPALAKGSAGAKKSVPPAKPPVKVKDTKDAKDSKDEGVPAGDIGELWGAIAWLLEFGRTSVAGTESVFLAHPYLSQLLSLPPPRSPVFADRHLLSKPSQRDTNLLITLLTGIAADAKTWSVVDKNAWSRAVCWCATRADTASRNTVRDGLARVLKGHLSSNDAGETVVKELLGVLSQATIHVFSETGKERRILDSERKPGGAEDGDDSHKTWPDDPVRSDGFIPVRAWRFLDALIPGVKSSPELSHHAESFVLDLIIVGNHEELVRHSPKAWEHLVKTKLDKSPDEILESKACSLSKGWLSTLTAPTSPSIGIEGNLHPDSDAGVRLATIAAIRLLVRHAAAECANQIVAWSVENLRSESISSLSAEDVAIWRTPAGSLHFDPVMARRSKQGQRDDRPKTKVEKWEAEVRKELEKRKSTSKDGDISASKVENKSDIKLTKEEVALREAQLKKEEGIRGTVNSVVYAGETALTVLNSVLDGARDGRRDTYELGSLEDPVSLTSGAIVDAFITILRRELTDDRWRPDGFMAHAIVFGQRVVDSWVKLGHLVLGKLARVGRPPTIQMTALRLVGIKQVDPEVEGDCGIDAAWVKGKTDDAFARVLSQATASNEPLLPPTFQFLWPAFDAVLRHSGRSTLVPMRNQVPFTSQALDFVVRHCNNPLISSTSLTPRRQILASLLVAGARFPVQFKDQIISGVVALAKGIGGAASDDLELDELNFEEDQTDAQSPAIELLLPGEDDQDFLEEAVKGTFNGEPVVREAAVAALEFLEPIPISDDLKERLDTAVWIQRYDSNAGIKHQADTTWVTWNGEEPLGSNLLKALVKLTVHDVNDIRVNAGKAIAATLPLHPEYIASTMESLYSRYKEEVTPPKPKLDEYGMAVRSNVEKPDNWEIRLGIAKALTKSTLALTNESLLIPFFNFLIEDQALGDKAEEVRGEMLNASIAAISKHGKTHIQDILPILDGYLSKGARPTETADRIREAVVISLGTLAKDLDPTDPHVTTVVQKLIETLSTPSETVQVAVSECLPPLIKALKDTSGDIIGHLLKTLFEGNDYGTRRGAAYGLAGAVKGRGIGALKEFNIIASLKEASEDKKVKERREGAAMAYETMTLTLGRLFEPYIIQIIPLLLPLFGDQSKDVRDAAWEASKAIMSKISAHGVKLILPSLLSGLDDKNWRAKAGSIELLGSMAFLAPKQLSASLPVIFPRLSEVLSDSHMKVQQTAKEAMDRFGEVIKNPEVQTIIPLLLGALVDPNKQTGTALTALLETAFVHYIDAPSLAVIVPILNRGMRERSTDTRKKAAQIIGNMSSVTETRDLIPYLHELVPQLRMMLADPVPEARAISAKALGTLVHKLGEDNFSGLVSDLVQTLKSEQSATVDRSGAAQGLSEVLASLPIDRLESLLPEVVSNASSVRSFVREGFVTLLVYLPATFRERFQPYLGMCIPVILRGLADETETVREASLRAGQMIIKNYSSSAMELLLPELEKGLFDDNWRIRQSSVTLLGDLLYRIVGISGRTQIEGGDDATLGTETGRRALLEALGPERYQNIMAAVYIIRNDTNLVVRNTSLHVWKSVVSNTPRTLKEILGTMMTILIDSLASSSYDKRTVAARTLSDLVRKLGEQVLAEILPVFERGMESDSPDTRQGVCIGVSEVLSNAGSGILENFEEELTPIVQQGLMDSDPEVREAAAQAFDTLHEQMGSRAIDEIIPYLLKELKGGESAEYAMEGLRSVMSVRGQVVFPVLLPTLLQKPLTASNARILGSLIAVAGASLARRLSNIISSLMDALEETKDDEVITEVKEAVKSLARVIDEDSLHPFMTTLFESFKDDGPGKRQHTCTFVGIFFEESRLGAASQYIPDWISNLIGLLQSKEQDLLVAAWTALDSLVKSVAKEELDRYVIPAKRALSSLLQHRSQTEEVRGFNLPKGVSPILSIFNQGVLVTSPDIRETSAQGISELVCHTGADALKPFSTQIAGPLIRVITDRIQPQVKAAILDTLRRLLEKLPVNMKPFLPQLQRTFIKSLGEASAPVRENAATATAVLIQQQTRLDPIVADLTSGLKTAEERSIKQTFFVATRSLLVSLGNGREISAASKVTMEKTVVDATFLSGENDDALRVQASQCFAPLLKYVKPDDRRRILDATVLSQSQYNSPSFGHGVVISVYCVLRDNPHLLEYVLADVIKAVFRFLEDSSNKISTLIASVGAATKLWNAGKLSSDDKSLVIDRFAKMLEDGPSDLKRVVLLSLQSLAAVDLKDVGEYAQPAVPRVWDLVRDRNIPVKLAAERALIALFGFRERSPIMQTYLSNLDSSIARSLGDYARRVLTKIADEEAAEDGDDVNEEIEASVFGASS